MTELQCCILYLELVLVDLKSLMESGTLARVQATIKFLKDLEQIKKVTK